jgi:ketosteroid isomerase-like protein
VESDLIVLEKKFAAAIASNDVSAIERYLSPDWVIIDPDGSVIDRAKFLEVVKSGALVHDSIVPADLRVRNYGSTAVITALTTSSGKFMGHAFQSDERATDVFIQQNGQWVCVLTHLCRVAKKV